MKTRSQAHLLMLSGVWQGAAHVARSAATVALGVEGGEGSTVLERARYDLGQATMAMMIAATIQIGAKL